MLGEAGRPVDLGGLWIPFQACSGQASAHPAGRGQWAWRAEHQKAWDAGIGGVVRACLPRPRAQGPPAALTVGCTLFPAAPGVSCRVRTGLSQSQCEKAGEAPHRPAPQPTRGPQRPSEESPWGRWGRKEGPLQGQLRPLHSSLSLSRLLFLSPQCPGRTLGPGKVLDLVLRLCVASMPQTGLFSFPLCPSRTAKPGKTSKYHLPLLAYPAGQ